jgi:tripartite-type tricarboxylate transporter receptor subunit TctC
MVTDSMIKKLVASYVTSPQGMEMILTYISSSNGQAAIRQYLKTPGGKQIALDIMPLLLDVIEIPDDVKNTVRECLGNKN